MPTRGSRRVQRSAGTFPCIPRTHSGRVEGHLAHPSPTRAGASRPDAVWKGSWGRCLASTSARALHARTQRPTIPQGRIGLSRCKETSLAGSHRTGHPHLLHGEHAARPQQLYCLANAACPRPRAVPGSASGVVAVGWGRTGHLQYSWGWTSHPPTHSGRHWGKGGRARPPPPWSVKHPCLPLALRAKHREGRVRRQAQKQPPNVPPFLPSPLAPLGWLTLSTRHVPASGHLGHQLGAGASWRSGDECGRALPGGHGWEATGWPPVPQPGVSRSLWPKHGTPQVMLEG